MEETGFINISVCRIHVLQLTNSCILFPMYITFINKMYIGSIIYTLNFFSTIIVHNTKRTNERCILDYMDYCLLIIWFTYNFTVFLSNICYFKDCILLWLVVLFCFFNTCFFNYKRLLLEYRTEKRNLYHGLMHINGSLGTLALVLIDINKG